MPAFPTSAELTGATLTEAQFKTGLNALLSAIVGLTGSTGDPAQSLAALGAPLSSHVAKTAAYTVALGDRGRVIACSGSWTLSLPGAATAGAGFNATVINTGTGAITIDPSGAETVDASATLVLAPGQAVALICTGTAWLTLGRPGPGIGLTTQVPLVADMADIALPVGIYRFDGTTLNNTSGTSAGILQLVRYNSATLAQIVVTGTLYLVRYYASGAWGAWRRLYSTANILAPVGLSSGVPTGGILERGSNANGEYVRFADGTQICWSPTLTFDAVSNAGGSGFRSNALSWTFPAAFASGSTVACTGQSSNLGRWMSFTLPGLTAVNLQLWAFTSFAGSETGRAIAIGRWA